MEPGHLSKWGQETEAAPPSPQDMPTAVLRMLGSSTASWLQCSFSSLFFSTPFSFLPLLTVFLSFLYFIVK